MFEIHAVPPGEKKERLVTTRPTRERADAYARTLSGFGYAKPRVAEGAARTKAPEQVQLKAAEPPKVP